MTIFNDNSVTCVPELLTELAHTITRQPQLAPYGCDEITESICALIQREFGPTHSIHFLPTGTAANVIALRALLHPTDAVICSDKSHLLRDECSAPTVLGAGAIIPIKSSDGKITPEQLTDALKDNHGTGAFHHPSVRMVSISQPTELGQVYSLAELRRLVSCAREHNLLVHVDGARLFYAAAALKCPLRACGLELGIDVLTVGLSKVGGLFGDILLFFSCPNSKDPLYTKRVQKQCLSLLDKTWMISSQANFLLQGERWRVVAATAIRLAKMLESEFTARGLCVSQKVESNAVFVKLSTELRAFLLERHTFYVWDFAEGISRFMLTAQHTKEDIKALLADVDEFLGRSTVQTWRDGSYG